MKAIAYTLAVFWKEVQLIVKDLGSLALMLLLPLLLGAMMGGINLMAAGDEEAASILVRVLLVNQDAGVFGTEVAKAVEAIDELDVEIYQAVAEAEARVAEGEATAAIVIPADFSQRIDAHEPTAIDVVVDPGQRESASIVAGIMNQVVDEVTIWGEVEYGIRTVLAESGVLASASVEQQRAAEAQTLGVIMTRLNELRRTPAIAVVSEDLAGIAVEGGWGAYFAVLFPGLSVMFIFLNVSWSASSLLQERESGALRRLIAAPLPRATVIAGKTLAFMLLACLQALVMFAVGHIFFNMPLGQSPVALVLLTLVVALTSAAMGMMIAALAKTSNQASNIGVILGIILAVIGGCIAMAPEPAARAGGFMGTLASLTPHGHAVEAYFRLTVENAGLVQILPQMAILLVVTVVFFLVAVWWFRFE